MTFLKHREVKQLAKVSQLVVPVDLGGAVLNSPLAKTSIFWLTFVNAGEYFCSLHLAFSIQSQGTGIPNNFALMKVLYKLLFLSLFMLHNSNYDVQYPSRERELGSGVYSVKCLSFMGS